MDIGKRIKNLRDAKGLTQEKLGKIIGVSKATINRYETEEIDIKRTTAIKLGKALNVPPSYIMGWSSSEIANNHKIVEKYNALNPIGQQKTDIYVDDLLGNPRFRKEPKVVIQSSPPREIAAYGADGTKGIFTKKPKEIT